MEIESPDSYVIRTAGIHNLDQIEVLFIGPNTRQVGDKKEPPLTHLFDEYRSHRMVVHLKDDPNRLLAYSEFSIHPNIAVLSNELWVQWLKCRFCVDVPVTLMNTMFLNFYIYNLKHEKILKQVLTEVYYREHKLLFLIVTRPPKYEPKDYEPFEKLGTPYYPIDYDIEKGKDLPTLIIFKRDQLIPKITFRRALPEDNDDVVEMIDVDMPEMRKEHGDFFIAELLLGTSGGSMDNDKIIVTEDPTTGGSSGMMWLSDDVDLQMMVTNFDLESFGNLVRYTPNVPHESVEFEVYATEYTHYTLDRKVYHFNKRSTFNTEKTRLQAAFKYIDDELRRGSTYLRKAVKVLKISFDAPIRKSHSHHHHHSHGHEKVNLQRACKAFMLKNFLLHPSLRLEYTFYYLCAMFSAYPELDYCIVRVPLGSKMSASLCALLQYFTRVPHRPKVLVSDEMFVAHRTSINTDIDIYPFEKDDLTDMLELLQQRPRISSFGPSIESMTLEAEMVFDEATKDLIEIIEDIAVDVLYNEKSEFNLLIIRAGSAGRDNSTTVGFVILRPFADYGSVYKQFMLPFDEDNFTFERGELIMLRLHPYFSMWSDAILRTVSLRTGYRDLYYFQPFLKTVLPNDLVSRMMPVEPRRMRRNWFIEPSSESWINRSSKEASLPPVNYMTDYFYLFRHNLHQSKNFGSHTRLVILGFSDICKALLRLMIFGWNTADFRNVNSLNCLPWLDVTVIVKYGEIEAEYNHDKICNNCGKEDNCYLDSDHCCPFVMDATKRIDLRNWVHFVPGVVKYINRTEKTVQLENSCKISYEKLLLLCDTNYGLSPEIEEKLNIKKNYQTPSNYVSINSHLEKMLLYFKVHELISSPLTKKSIIVFGCTLTVYECINFLLKHNCRPEDITLVQPHKICRLKFESNPTEDTNVEWIMTQMVSDLGIRVYESCQLEGFVLDQNFTIQVANFVYFARPHSFSLHCKLFINFQEMYMPSATEKVLQRSGIDIKDRQIRVDHTFCTNDPNIYAAGKNVIIKDQVFYQYNQTSELEMAEKLLDIMQLSLEPYTKEKRFSRPKMFHVRFPKGFVFIKVTKPKRYMLGKLDNTFCHTMTTYQNSQFCRVSLSTTWILNEITCVIRNPKKDYFFLEYFVGKHETLLNNLRGQFKNGYIDNFIDFFQDPWTEFIMHDRFPEMQSKNRDTLIALLQQRQDGKKAMNIGDSDFKVTCKHFVEANLLKFLRAHRREFVNEFVLPEDWESLSQ